jgi:hypothetical protein
VRALWIAAFAIAALAGDSAAGEPPDSAALVRLQGLTRAAVPLKVTTARATFNVSNPQLDAGGLSAFRDREAMFGTPEARPMRRLSWSEIERIDLERGDPVAGALRGGLVGGLLGFGCGYLLLARLNASANADGAVFVLLLSSASGVVTGGVVGGLTVRRDERIYP